MNKTLFYLFIIDYKKSYKVLILGIGSIGKTSLIYRYAENRVYNPLNPMSILT